ncbi:hypothetical protein R9C00_17680 [Flammeovirgaceae bacterium SG7u.111]|nr:hypothetical protein [Flammeovirgaceae bacterium SG7u.132]WPO33535.1 hypothetical protein R9C00_17680 [Flammeovirgaceae bacterium SG7u.111]
MEEHFELSDREFEERLANCTIDPILFSHEAHLRLAWIHIRNYGIEKAIENICGQIQKFACFHGSKDKYNATVTVAAVRAVYHFMLKSHANTFQELVLEFPRLKNKFKDLLECHYSINIFLSEEAKNEYVEPDLQPFD